MKQLLFLLSVVVMIGCKPKEEAGKNARESWNIETTLRAYEQHGNKNEKWDADAKRTLGEYVKLRVGITNYDQRMLTMNLVEAYASSAINKGCDDPLVEYLHCRYASNMAKGERTKRWCATADKMQGSLYGPVRKFFANIRASQNLWQDRNTNVWSQVLRYQNAAIENFVEMAQDKNTPIQEIEEIGHDLIETVAGRERGLKAIIDGGEPHLVQNWPDHDVTHSIRASLYYYYAWRARGGGYADEVTEAGWEGFRERLSVATKAAQRSWELNTNNTVIPTLMIKLAEATQMPRETMESWFDKAMALQPNNYQACQAKLHYLYPQWYGSRQEMIKFGRECVQSEAWTGTVPLILVDAHDQIADYIKDKAKWKSYWLQPEVWADVSSAYDRFFDRNPDALRWRHNYAKYAYRCEQWDALNEQIKLLGDVDYSYFGGEREFDKMVQLAKERSRGTKD